MQLSYKSVTLFYADLKALLIGSGMTVEREISSHDVILDAGGGTYLRLQKTATATVNAVGVVMGTDPEVLSLTDPEAERCLPFTFAPQAEFVPTCHWVPEEQFLTFLVAPGPGSSGVSRRYRVDFRIKTREKSVFHQDHLNPQYQPNFKDTGGPFIAAGV